MAFLLFCPGHEVSGWGFWAHKRLNYHAVANLPAEMSSFFMRNRQWLATHAVDADTRRYCHADEKPRHYIDIDLYGISPFRDLPRKWNIATAMYGEARILENGILPWAVQWEYRSLVRAFLEGDSTSILWHSAILGHYVGDAHVPFHTTCNHDGQYTDQTGIHALWESRMPEYFGYSFSFPLLQIDPITDVEGWIWSVILQSHQLVLPALKAERHCTDSFGEEKFCYLKKRTKLQRFYSTAFMDAYYVAQGAVIEKQMQKATQAIAALWYTAWLEAGQPILSNFKETASKVKQEEVPDIYHPEQER